MRVLHIVSSLSRNAGGPARSVQGLVAGLNAAGVDAWLMAMKPLGEPWVEGVAEKFRCANKMKWFGMQCAVENAIDELKPDLVHIHSIWQWTLHLAVMAAREKRIPYILAPRGTIEEWSLKQKWLKKKIALLTYQGSDFRHAAAIHCTAESEASQARKFWPGKQIIISPNGVNVPKSFIRKNHVDHVEKKKVLFMSRMHPKKGVMELVEAWGRLVVSGQSLVVSGWECELVYTIGNAAEREYETKIKARVKELGLQNQFFFLGALDDEKKWEAYARADLFVLPTYSENFGIVVAEALYAGVPVITTTGTPWSDLNNYQCGWWIDIGVEPLSVALASAMSLTSQDREHMGAKGHSLVEQKYTWGAVISDLIEGYHEILKR